MKYKLMTLCMMCMMTGWSSAQSVGNDSTRLDKIINVDELYAEILEYLKHIEIKGSHKATNEIRERWYRVLNGLNAQKGNMAEDVRNLLVSPSGKTIDLDLIREIINVKKVDSINKIELNMDFFFDEIKAAGDKIKKAAVKMAEKK